MHTNRSRTLGLENGTASPTCDRTSAQCPVLAGADIGRTRWPKSSVSIRNCPSDSAKPSTELLRAELFGGGNGAVTRISEPVAQGVVPLASATDSRHGEITMLGRSCNGARSNAQRNQNDKTYPHNQHRNRDEVIIEPVFVF